MRNQRSTIVSVLSLLLCFAVISACGLQTSVPPTATIIPFTATPSATETPTPIYLTSTLNPVAQGYHRMAYDSESGKVILLNLQGNTGAMLSAETWAFDSDTKAWEKRSTAPTNGEGPMTYNSQSDRVIVFLGAGGVQMKSISRTLAYDYNSDTWTDMNPAEAPFGILGARMVYDSESDKVILFGGLSTENFRTELSDIWAYDYESNTWTNMQPTGTPPAGENYFAMSYDARADRVIAWRCEPNKPQCKIGAYDYNSNTWEQREPETSPASRVYNAMVYDPKTGLNILFGGQGYTGITNETWGYDYASNSWTLIQAINPPDPRSWHAMTYDEKAGLILMFGGGKNKTKFTDETWAYDPVKGEWALYQIQK